MKKLFFLLLVSILSAAVQAQNKTVAEQLVDEQLNGYNKRDIEAFLKPYADSVAVYMFPNQFLYKGKETMRSEYTGMFQHTPDLFCTVKCRTVLGNKVIDEESVVFNKNKPPLHAAAIYTIANNKIVAVHFIQ